MTRQVVVEVVGDAKKFNRATNEAIESAGGLTTKLQGVGKGMVLGAGIASFNLLTDAIGRATDFVFDSIDAASDLNETVSKTGVVFGDSAADVLKWGENSAKAFGMSKNAALGAAATYGNLFVSLGLSGDAAADMSTEMVELAGDLASFNNASPEETLLALRSGLVGETEPLRRFGISISDAALRQKALEMGLVTTTNEVLPAAIKAQASYALILEQSGTAQGDFSRTSEGLANQQRIAAAQLEDLSAEIGSVLLPVMVTLATFVTTELFPALRNIGAVLSEVWEASEPLRAGLVAALEPVGAFVTGTLVPAFGTIASAFGDIWAATEPVRVELLPILADIAAWIADALVSTLSSVADVFGFIWDASEPVRNALVPALELIAGFVTDGMLPVLGRIIDIFADIWEATEPIRNALGPALTVVFDIISVVIDGVVGTIENVIARVQEAIEWVQKLASILGPSDEVQDFRQEFRSRTGRDPTRSEAEQWRQGTLPGFAEGGIVPGPRGAPMEAIVHGGERIIPAGESAWLGSVTITPGAIVINSGDLDEKALARLMLQELKREVERQGMSLAGA